MASPSGLPTFRAILALIKSPSLSTCDFIPYGASGAVWLACTALPCFRSRRHLVNTVRLPFRAAPLVPLSHRLVPPNVNEQLL